MRTMEPLVPLLMRALVVRVAALMRMVELGDQRVVMPPTVTEAPFWTVREAAPPN